MYTLNVLVPLQPLHCQLNRSSSAQGKGLCGLRSWFSFTPPPQYSEWRSEWKNISLSHYNNVANNTTHTMQNYRLELLLFLSGPVYRCGKWLLHPTPSLSQDRTFSWSPWMALTSWPEREQFWILFPFSPGFGSTLHSEQLSNWAACSRNFGQSSGMISSVRLRFTVLLNSS